MAEYYEKMPSLSKSKIDGVWKRAYEIIYVNGVAVDTTSVPSDVILDVKVIKDGYFLYQVDKQKFQRSNQNPGIWWMEVLDKLNIQMTNIREYMNLDQVTLYWIQSKNLGQHGTQDMKFYDDDMFLQIDKEHQIRGQSRWQNKRFNI